MEKIRKTGLIVFATILLIGSWAIAEASTVRRSVEVTGATVTLGDLVSEAGEAADVVLYDAPAPGKSYKIPLSKIIAAARRHGIKLNPEATLRNVTVHRAGHKVSGDEFTRLLRDAIKLEGFGPRFEVRLSGVPKQLYLPLDDSTDNLRLTDISLDQRTGQFRATIAWRTGDFLEESASLNGRAIALRDIPVLRRELEAGEIITDSDIAWQEKPANMINLQTITRASDLIGKALRRKLRSGSVLRATDIEKPLAVRRGELVTMVLQRPGLSLSAVGRAMEHGAIGDFIRLTNIDTRLQIEGRVTGAGQVIVLSRTVIVSN